MSDLFINHLWQWLLLVAALIFAIYTLFIIKNEVQTYQEDASPLEIGNIEIDIANWWTLVESKKYFFHYERRDTRYEWFAKLQYCPTQNFKKIQDVFEQYLYEQKIFFDPDVNITTEPSHLFINPQTRSKIIECLRVEGKATQNQSKRIYWDIFVFRIEHENSYYIFESWSSVLNGMLEGPFFEEAVTNMRILSHVN